MKSTKAFAMCNSVISSESKSQTYRQRLVEVVKDGNLDRKNFPALDRRWECQVQEEGGEGGDGRPFRESNALLGMGAPGLADPLRDRVREMEILLDDSA